jgi:hypothetical protein
MEELLRRVPLFAWLPEGAFEVLNGCFDLEAEQLKQGETREDRGRVGCLLTGSASFCPNNSPEVTLSPGELFGIARGTDGGKHPVPGSLTADTDCAVAWFDFNLVRTVCYRACWFHVRLLREIDALL